MSETKKALNRGDILKAFDRDRELVDVPEWGGSVYVQAMSAYERAEFIEEVSLAKDKPVTSAVVLTKLLALCVADEDGVRIFSDQDREALGTRSILVLDRLANIALRINGLGQENARGNSPSGQSEDSTSA